VSLPSSSDGYAAAVALDRSGKQLGRSGPLRL